MCSSYAGTPEQRREAFHGMVCMRWSTVDTGLLAHCYSPESGVLVHAAARRGREKSNACSPSCLHRVFDFSLPPSGSMPEGRNAGGSAAWRPHRRLGETLVHAMGVALHSRAPVPLCAWRANVIAVAGHVS